MDVLQERGGIDHGELDGSDANEGWLLTPFSPRVFERTFGAKAKSGGAAPACRASSAASARLAA